jgi:hypothetical protein
MTPPPELRHGEDAHTFWRYPPHQQEISLKAS